MRAGRGAVRRLNPVEPHLRTFAKQQRARMTKAEELFWEQVRGKRFQELKFKRQVPIGPYVVDFLRPSARLIVELDGQPHENAERRERDKERDTWLKAQGFTIVRFSNDLILGSLELALRELAAVVQNQDGPSPAPASQGHPPPQRGEGYAVP